MREEVCKINIVHILNDSTLPKKGSRSGFSQFQPGSEILKDPRVLIIGAGMTGILLAIRMMEEGIRDILILEKKEDLGGTWRENIYPGVACDIPAHMYTYSFEPNPEWKYRFARGDEIQAYFKKVSDKYRVTPLIHFKEAVVRAEFKDHKWHVRSSKGNEYIVDFLFSATGILHHPAKPDIKGIDSFRGPIFHTAEWDRSVEMKHKRIGVIGTGSTAAQVIPELVHTEGTQVYVFQRTPQWIANIPDKKYSEFARKILRISPFLAKILYQIYTFAIEQTFSKAVIGKKLPNALMTYICKRNLEKSVKDPELKKKLTPNYRVGCKRVLVNETFYPAIQKPNAHLITEGIREISSEGIVLNNGEEIKLDVIVLATGFHPFNFMRPMELIGKDGITIEEAWKKKVQCYRHMFIPGFPNFFLMLGPNTPIGNFSVIAMSEVQTNYLMKVLRDWRRGQFLEISAKKEAMERFNEYLKKGMKHTVWVGGCKSWYLDADGDPAMWPYTWKQWTKEMSEPDYRDFELVPVVEFAESKSQ